MVSNSWINSPSIHSSSSSSRRYQSRSDLSLGDIEGDNDLKAEFLCPFCADEFDIVDLCCHIDEQHPIEAKNGMCPVCTKRVGSDIIGHITTQHGNIFKVQRRRRLRRVGNSSSSAYLTLKKELREGNFHSLGGSSTLIQSSNIDCDPLLSSFISNSPPSNGFVVPFTKEESVTKVSPKDNHNKGNIRQVTLSNEDQEKLRKSEFVRGLVLSTFLENKF